MRKVNCFLCMDKGYVFVRSGIYQTFCHCECVAGNDHRYDERPEGGRYFVSCVNTMLDRKTLEEMRVANARNYAKWARADQEQSFRKQLPMPNLAGLPPEREHRVGVL